jgi:hypothetical protein
LGASQTMVNFLKVNPWAWRGNELFLHTINYLLR